MIIARNYLEVYPYDKWNAKVLLDILFYEGKCLSCSSLKPNCLITYLPTF